MRPILVTGISGFIGGHVWAVLSERDDVWGIYGSSGKVALKPERQLHFDLSQTDSICEMIEELQPRCILHLAAVTLKRCRNNAMFAWKVNNVSVRELAKTAEKIGTRVILSSTEMVFSGEGCSYREGDPPNPRNIYAETKTAAERSLFASASDAVVVRIASSYGPPKFGGSSFSEWILEREQKKEPITLFTDQYRSFIDVVTLSNALIELIDHPFKGLLHLGGANRANRVTFGEMLLRMLGRNCSGIVRLKNSDMDPEGENPLDVSFDITLARQILNTKIPGIEKGIALAYNVQTNKP